MTNLLVELFVEELPPKALRKLGAAFASLLADGLKARGLAAADAAVTSFASPRRLAAHVTAVAAKAADRSLLQKLMPVAVGLDAAGAPTPALLKKLAALGHDASVVARLERRPDGKTEALFIDSLVAGETLADGLQKALAETLAQLPIPKVMSYQLADGWTSVDFVRPAHGLVALHGDAVVAVSALGLHAGRVTHGHRFEAATPTVSLRDADSYAEQLEREGAVIASFAARRAEIARQLAAAAEGLKPVDDDALLDEVTGLVERPNVLRARFPAEFLAVPPECLVLTMKANQKYFPLLDGDGRLTNRFLVVSNIRPADARRVIEGNERVVRPRLADAKFFFDQDRKKTLESRVPALAKVVYHAKLGSMGERVERVRAIARAIARMLRADAPRLGEQADRAAMLAKADLLTDMVGEFPELQGIMGGYYARHDGESEAVALAIEDHYKPRFAGDALPRDEVGVVVALADKLETLAGLFGIGQAPTGDKDPFALRRHALGVLRLLIERQLPLRTADLMRAANATAATDIEFFLRDRLAVMFRDQGYSAPEVAAVLDAGVPAEIWLVPQRLAAVRAFAALPEAPALAAANKRVGNILKKSDGAAPVAVDPDRFAEAAERALYVALNETAPRADVAFRRGDYTGSLQALAALKAPVDAFFDSVMVNVDDAPLRNNRLALLGTLHAAMNRVADLSRLAG